MKSMYKTKLGKAFNSKKKIIVIFLWLGPLDHERMLMMIKLEFFEVFVLAVSGPFSSERALKGLKNELLDA